jgi:hypothetical protein
VELEVGFTTSNIRGIDLNEEVVLEAMHETIRVSESVLDDEEVPRGQNLSGGFLLKLGAQASL